MAAAFSGNGYTLTESLSGEEFAVIYRDFGFQNAIARDSASLSCAAELALYRRYGVICNLSGHLHIQHTAQIEQGLWEIAASSLAVSPCQYGVLTLAGTEADYHIKVPDVFRWAEKCERTTPDLLAFSDYAETFFRDASHRQAMAELTGEPKARPWRSFSRR